MDKSEKITLIGVGLNFMLFIAKITVGLISGSLSLLSDAFNSLTDILSYTGIYFAVKISNKKADETHPFGHRRAEPLAGLLVAIFAGILAIEIIKSAITGIMNPQAIKAEFAACAVLIFTIIVKTFMTVFFSKKGRELNRPAIRAAGVDSRNDVLISGVALIGVIGPWMGVHILDGIAAIFISLFIFYSGYKIATENLDYLMGKCPPPDFVEHMKKAALSVKGVNGLNDVRAHYVGNYVHVEIHIEVDKKITIEKAHKIGKDVQNTIEKLDSVDKAFVHIDPQ
ncbi:MAG: cation diffusion facilitator family transporter [archaeon]